MHHKIVEDTAGTRDTSAGKSRGASAPGWRGAPKHGLALPTANSELGSVIADENVLAVRDLTMPPFTQGPWSSVARDTSQLGRLSLDGQALYTQHSRWTPLGFERNATARDGRAVHTEVRLPLVAE